MRLWFKDKASSSPPVDTLSICFVARRFPILGRSTDQGFLWPIARGLAKKGHKVTVLSTKSSSGKTELLRDGVQVYYVLENLPPSSSRRFDKMALEKLTSLLKTEKFDLVHCMDRSGLEISKRKKQLNVAVAYDVEATQMAQIFSLLGMVQENVRSWILTMISVLYKFATTYIGGDRELLKTADGVFVTNPNQRIFLERYYLFPDYHTYSVPYGIELGTMAPREQAQDLRTKYNLPENAHLVLTLTDMSEAKEVEVLLQAFERVAVKKPNAYMAIIGHGPGWKEIEFTMLSLALGRRVIMAGIQSEEEISDWLSLAEVYVNLSSRTTGFEPTIIEAMAQKKVVIGSEVSPIAHVIEEGQDGFLIRPADHEALAQLLIEIFSGSLPIQDIGHRAHEKITNLFDMTKMVQSIEEAYRKILKASR